MNCLAWSSSRDKAWGRNGHKMRHVAEWRGAVLAFMAGRPHLAIFVI